jgi:hypothetical protein
MAAETDGRTCACVHTGGAPAIPYQNALTQSLQYAVDDVIGVTSGRPVVRRLGSSAAVVTSPHSLRTVRLAYEPPASGTFLSEQTRHQ